MSRCLALAILLSLTLLPQHGAARGRGRSNQARFREVSHLPRLERPRDRRHVTVIVGEGGRSDDLVRDILRGPNHYNRFDQNAPRVANTVIPADQIRSRRQLRSIMQRAARRSDLIIVRGHGNPCKQVINDRVTLDADFFRGLDLRRCVLVLDGCNTGARTWREDMFAADSPRRHLIGRPVSSNKQLLESAMRFSRPRFAVGHTTSVDNTEARYEWCLALMGGGQPVGGADLPSTRVLQNTGAR
jgi:hypothetical protein